MGTVTCAPKADVDEKVRVVLREKQQATVLVKLREQGLAKTASPAERLQQIQRLQEAVLSSLNKEDFQLRYRYQTVAGFSGVLFESGLPKLLAHPEVEKITLDEAGQGGRLEESVPAIKADIAYGLGFTGEGVTVGVLDSGVDLDHPDLENDIVYEYHFLNQGNDVGAGAPDQHGHGTNVTGIVTSDGTVAPRGVAPKAKIVAIQVLDRNNRGWVSDWIAGIDHIVANNTALHVQVINMSLVTDALYDGANCDNAQNLFAAAVNAAKSLGIAVFACAGNNGSITSLTAPACLSGSTAVGAVYDSNLGRQPNSGTYRNLFGGFWPDCADATTSSLTLACFTNRTAKVELVAPGCAITSTRLNGGRSTYIGTSQASPQAAGVAALMLQKYPGLQPAAIVSMLKNSSVRVSDPGTRLSFPFLNAIEALNQVTQVGTPAAVPPQTFTLEQNFPNPLRSTTTADATAIIKYALPQPAMVTLSIFNLVGQEVQRLVQTLQTAGMHQIAFDSRALAPGVYFCLLEAGAWRQVRKLVVIP
jgi:subtilisin family serine protease